MNFESLKPLCHNEYGDFYLFLQLLSWRYETRNNYSKDDHDKYCFYRFVIVLVVDLVRCLHSQIISTCSSSHVFLPYSILSVIGHRILLKLPGTAFSVSEY